MSVGWPRRRDGHRGCGRRGGGRRRECARGVRPVAPSRAGTFVLAVHPRLELLVVVERGLVAEVGAYGLLGLLTGCPPARPEPAEEPPHRRRPEPRAPRDLKSGLLPRCRQPFRAESPPGSARPCARPPVSSLSPGLFTVRPIAAAIESREHPTPGRATLSD